MIWVDGERLWADLMAMAAIGATDRGGSRRLALSDEDIAGRALFLEWCAAQSYAVTHDALGTLYARRDGRDPTLSPLVLGSHLDTQPTGGRFDGVLGVLAGLEVLRTLDRHNIETERPVEVACWTNEEGARFAPAMMASGVFAGALDLDEVLATADLSGKTVADELVRHGLAAGFSPSEKAMQAYLELHIEQGPVLEAAGETIGVVTGGQAIRWYDVTLTGDETHAGPTPMAMRRDPVVALRRVLALTSEIGARDDAARATVGVIETLPGSRNVVPGTVSMTIDLRHPEETVLAEMDARLRSGLAAISDGGVSGVIREVWHSPAVTFDPDLAAAVERAATAFGYPHRRMISGAGHDAFYVARRVPTALIFVPCRGGVSHNEAEYAEPAHVTAGANVLLHTAMAAAGAR